MDFVSRIMVKYHKRSPICTLKVSVLHPVLACQSEQAIQFGWNREQMPGVKSLL